jgi:hypothetical protein
MELSIINVRLMCGLAALLLGITVGEQSTPKDGQDHLDIVFKAKRADYVSPMLCDRGNIKLVYKTKNVVRSIDINNREKTLFETPEYIEDTTLTCSNDGSLISAIDQNEDHLYIYNGSLSVYQLEPHMHLDELDRISGIRAVMSADGSVFLLPSMPRLVAGEDILKKKKIIISKWQTLGWINQQPYTHDRAGNLFVIEPESGARVLVLKVPKSSTVQRVSNCYGQSVVAAFYNDEKTRVYPFHNGILDKQSGSKGSSLVSNGQECIYSKDVQRHSILLSNGTLNKIYYDEKRTELNEDDKTIAETAFYLSGNGCLIMSRIGAVGGEEIFIFRNPFKLCA